MNQNNVWLTESALMDLEKQVQRDIPRFGPNVRIGVRAGLLREMLSKLRAPVADAAPEYAYSDDGRTVTMTNAHRAPSRQASVSVADTPRVDELMAKWDDDGATRGPAFIELRDLARELERRAVADVVTANMIRLAREAYDKAEFPELNKWKRALHAALASAPVAGAASTVWKHTHRVSGEVKLSLEDLAELPFNRDKWESVPHYAAPMIERVTPHASTPVAREAIRDAALEEAAQLIESTEETLAEEKPQQFVLRLLPRKNRDSIAVSGFAWAQAIRARKTNTKEQ